MFENLLWEQGFEPHCSTTRCFACGKARRWKERSELQSLNPAIGGATWTFKQKTGYSV